MVHFVFEDFLKSEVQYLACQAFWEQLVQDAAESLGQGGEWQPWIPRQTPNGTPVERDGNPIWDGRSATLNRAFRIIQHAPVENDLELVAWLKSYEEEYVDLPREELVLNLSLSEESAHLAKQLLISWMTPSTKVVDMQRLIRETIDPLTLSKATQHPTSERS